MRTLLTSLIAVLFAGQTIAAPASEGRHDFGLGFRYRFEFVDQDGLPRDAEASTLRTRFSYRTPALRGFSGFLEVDNVLYLGSTRFNNLRNGRGTYPVVADPRGTGLNQAYLRYANGSTEWQVGRQRINLGAQRFVGGVAWRQNEQTFDALTLTTRAVEQTTLRYAFVGGVSRIFGPDDPGAGQPDDHLRTNTHLLSADIAAGRLGDLSLYSYFMDFRDDAPALSNRTLGMRLGRTATIGDTTVSYRLEYARQQDHGSGPVDFRADFHGFEVAVKLRSVTLTAGWESLGGDAGSPGQAFRTPLATLHRFQGWSDKLLATPGAGVDDYQVRLNAKPFGANLAIAYHRLEPEDRGGSYGREWGLSLGRKVGPVAATFKVASYDANDLGTDTLKAWLMLAVSM